MAWTRSPRGRRRRSTGRRMFRRRKGFRATTEQGGRLERCHFNFLVDHPVDPGGSFSADLVRLAGAGAVIETLAGFGTQAAAVGRLLQNPLKGFDVDTIIMDVSATMDAGVTSSATPASETLRVGWAINTIRTDPDGIPAAAVPFWESQWPVNSGGGGLSSANEDQDFATRTHVARSGNLQNNVIVTTVGDQDVLVPGRATSHWYSRTRIKRHLGDTHGLYFQVWSLGAPFSPGIDSVIWHVTGSMWYRLKW